MAIAPKGFHVFDALSVDAFLDRLADDCYFFDADSLQLVHVNDRARARWPHGLPRRASLGEVFAQLDIAAFQVQLDALRGGEQGPVIVEATVNDADGGTTPVGLRVHYISAGARPLFMVQAWELAACGQPEGGYEGDALRLARDTEQRFRQLLEAAPDAIVLVDADGRMVLVNKMVEQLLGYSREELLGQPVEMLMPQRFVHDHQRHRQGFMTAPICRPMGAGLELVARRKDGSEFPVEISLSPSHFAGVTQVISVIRDVSQRRQAEAAMTRQAQALARSNADLQQFAYVASHDLQEPLRMVTSYLQLLARRYQGQLDQDADDFIDYALGGANRMRALIDDLLTYSRVTRQGQAFVPTDLNQVVKEVMTDLKIALEDSHGVAEVGDLPQVCGDPAQLRQVFQNLIGNALKFRGHEPPRIQIAAELEQEKWRISVADNGIGLDPRHRERVFAVFQRLHGQDIPGTGIGLAVCKRIIERHGGDIWVTSAAEGSAAEGGAMFQFTLPGTTTGGGCGHVD